MVVLALITTIYTQASEKNQVDFPTLELISAVYFVWLLSFVGINWLYCWEIRKNWKPSSPFQIFKKLGHVSDSSSSKFAWTQKAMLKKCGSWGHL